MAATGLLNTVYVIWIWVKFLKDFTNNTGFWFAWFGPAAVGTFLWIPMFVSWPAFIDPTA